MPNHSAILASFVNSVKAEVVHSLQENGRNATGETIRELVVTKGSEKSELTAPPYIAALEFGRKPTRANAEKGDPTLYDRIKVWATAKGIPETAVSESGKEINVWRAITRKIHLVGYKGKPGVLTIPLSNENLDRLLKAPLEKIAAVEVKAIAKKL